MAYVCLSRAPSLAAIELIEFDPTVIRANPSVRKYYAYIKRFGTHKGYQENAGKVTFPTTQELYQLVNDLPQLKAVRDAALAERRKREATAEFEDQQRQDQQQQQLQQQQPPADRDAAAATAPPRTSDLKRGAEREIESRPEHKRQRAWRPTSEGWWGGEEKKEGGG